MAAVCRFCDQEFANTQAVRAHLKGCTAYQSQRHAGRASGTDALGKALPIGSSRASDPEDARQPDGAGFDLVKQLEKQVSAGRLRFTLREIDEANAELDRRAEAKDRERDREAERQAALARSAEDEGRMKRDRNEQARFEQERREAASRRRRVIIQEVKQQVIGEPVAGIWPSHETKADALREIERALSPLDVADLPREELLTIARTVRDRVYRIAQRDEKEARDAENKARKDAQEQAERKHKLIENGIAYARRELEAVADLSGLERLIIEQRVERELQGIEGDESWSNIVDEVEDILESEGIEDDDCEEE